MMLTKSMSMRSFMTSSTSNTTSSLSSSSTSTRSLSEEGNTGTSAAFSVDRGNLDLESVAESFQEKLFKKHLVQDRTDRLNPLKTHAKSFLGKDAVTILQGILEKEQKKETKKKKDRAEITRQDALNVGRQIAREFHFFVHCGTDGVVELGTFTLSGEAAVPPPKELMDSELELYHFHYNLPKQVQATKKKYPSLWDKLALLESHVEIKERRQMFKVYENCFVAQEAIDSLLALKLVKSRKEAKFLVNRMNDRIHFCHHITDPEQEFDDGLLFFQLKPKTDRRQEPPKRPAPPQSLSSSSEHVARNNKDKRTSLLRRSMSMKVKSSSSDSLTTDESSISSSSHRNGLHSRRSLLKKARSIKSIRKVKSMGNEGEARARMGLDLFSEELDEEDTTHKTPVSLTPSSCQPLLHNTTTTTNDDHETPFQDQDVENPSSSTTPTTPTNSTTIRTKPNRKGGNKSRAEEIRQGLQQLRESQRNSTSGPNCTAAATAAALAAAIASNS